jgi:RNA polymerase sigma-70 factor (ECF subfamily)
VIAGRFKLNSPLVNFDQNLIRCGSVTRSSSSEFSQSDDAALVAAMSRGNAQALGQLYDRFAPVMLGLALRITTNRESAEDLVHEVFLEAWETAHSYDSDRGSVGTWLLLRTRSRCIDFRRAAHQSRNVAVAERFWAEHADAAGLDVSHAPDHAVIRTQLVNLPQDQRDALFLGYFEGLSSSEIAERMGSPVGTVKTRVAAALGKLREALLEQNRGEA